MIPYQSIRENQVRVPVDEIVQTVEHKDIINTRVVEEPVEVPVEIVNKLIQVRPVNNIVKV